MKRSLTALLSFIILIMPATLFSGDCGDINNDSSINIFDITHLISFLYLDGPDPDCGTITDIDGNVYQTITIGSQVWMMENLKVTHYRNGDPIPNERDNTAWAGLSTGAYCNYVNDEHNVATYGRLYNWYSVDDSRNIAPEGWHVPTDAEWQILVNYLGGGAVAGGKMKEAGTAHWNSPNTGATNESGFTGLPGEYRNYLGSFSSPMGNNAFFWSSTDDEGSAMAWFRSLHFDAGAIGQLIYGKQSGFSVRCVKD